MTTPGRADDMRVVGQPHRKAVSEARNPCRRPPGGGGSLYAPGFAQLSELTWDWRQASIRMKLFAIGLHPLFSPLPYLGIQYPSTPSHCRLAQAWKDCAAWPLQRPAQGKDQG